MKENKDVQINEKKPKKVIENNKEFEPKLVKEKCILIKDFSLNGEVKKKGTSIYLTKEGKEYLQTQFYIR